MESLGFEIIFQEGYNVSYMMENKVNNLLYGCDTTDVVKNKRAHTCFRPGFLKNNLSLDEYLNLCYNIPAGGGFKFLSLEIIETSNVENVENDDDIRMNLMILKNYCW